MPLDVEQLFVPVISHRLVFRLRLLARARASGWAAAIEDFRRQCLELAPVPGSEEDPLFEVLHRQPGLTPRDLHARAAGPPRGAVVRDDAELPARSRHRRGRPRPYQEGDNIHTIDWAASARLSSARQRDEFIVRERFAEEAPRVVVVADRRPEMAFFRPPLPWLDKAEAMRETIELIIQSAALVGGFIGYVDLAEGEPYWLPPQGGRRLWELREERLPSTGFDAEGQRRRRHPLPH